MPKNLARKAKNSKKQTRLTFDPIDRSSSPASALSPANVRYALPGTKYKSTPSSSLRKATAGSESDDVLSPATGESNGQTSATRKARALPLKGLPTPIKSSQPQFTAGFIDESEDDLVAPKPTPTLRSSVRKNGFVPTLDAKKRRAIEDADSSGGSEPEEETATPSKKPTKPQQKKIFEQTEISSDSGSDTDEDIPAIKIIKKTTSKTPPPRRSTRNGPASKLETITLTDDSDDGLVLPPPKSKQTQKGLFRSNKVFQSSSAPKHFAEDDDDEDEDDPIISSPKRSQRPAFRRKKQSYSEDEEEEDIKSSPRRRSRPIVAINLDDDEGDEEEEEIRSPLKRRRSVVQSDSESDIVESPLKRRRNAKASEDSDSDSDLPSLSDMRRRDRKTESPVRVTRQARIRRHRTQKEKTLELLKRKRAGENISELTETESSDSEDDENEPAFEKLSEFEDDDEEEEEIQPKPKVIKAKAKSNEGLDEDADEDFIVEDDEDDLIGVPMMHAIPLEFTHQAHKPLKEHFRDAVEWMVHNKINPAFPRDDPVYDQAFRKLESECSGLAKSKFSSTQWTRDFTTALYARPVFLHGKLLAGEGIDLESGKPKCDACNHRSHIPSQFIQFQGKAYSKKTLEELDQDDDGSDEDDTDDSSNLSVNDQGQDLPPEKTKWFVGRHCFANAEQSHTLIHWKFALYEWVKDTLENEGELLPAKLAKRDKMKGKQRTAYANALVDRWTAENQIKDLYRDFKNQVSTARELQQGKRGAWI